MSLEEILKAIKADTCKDEVPILLYDLLDEGKVTREWNTRKKCFVWRVHDGDNE